MRIITFLNHKGGVGKTTMAVTVACGLASKGLRVMVVDADGQGSATIALGFEKAPAFYDLIVRGAPYSQCLKQVAPERYMQAGVSLPMSDKPMKINGQAVLYLLAGNEETSGIDPMKSVSAIRRRLYDLAQDVDVIVIDTSPTPSKLHAGIYLATDDIIYVTETEFLSHDGLVSSLTFLEPANEFRYDNGIAQINVMGIIPNKYRPQTSQHSANLATMKEAYGEYVWSPINLRIAWSDSMMLGIPVYNYDNAEATAEAWGVIDRVYNNVMVKA